MEQRTDKGKILVKAIKSDKVKDLGAEYLELGLDTLLHDETLKCLPVVKSVIGICNFFRTVKDQILAKKIIRFINELSQIDVQERERMLDKLDEDDKFAGEVGEVIIEYLDKIDGEKKPELAAKFFMAFTRGFISYGDFRHCLLALERVPSFDIDKLVNFLERNSYSDNYEESVLLGFVNAGLGVNNGAMDGGVIVPTKLCQIFVNNCLRS
ncbi:hypothetical protein PUATCC27989T_05337 [Phytobacter ursingii]|nr:hypothetical protein PUATCC27989T_05337 [Phytobacter ursingii]